MIGGAKRLMAVTIQKAQQLGLAACHVVADGAVVLAQMVLLMMAALRMREVELDHQIACMTATASAFAVRQGSDAKERQTWVTLWAFLRC